MSTLWALTPSSASAVLDPAGGVVPEPPRCQQIGIPVVDLMSSIDGFRSRLVVESGGGGGGPATAGCSEPPMTSSTVLTVVPRAVRADSQDRKESSWTGGTL